MVDTRASARPPGSSSGNSQTQGVNPSVSPRDRAGERLSAPSRDAEPPSGLQGVEEDNDQDERDNLGQTRPILDPVAAELQELQEWVQHTKNLEELRYLREIRQRYEQGDLSALELVPNTSGSSTLRQPVSSGSLPRPEPPTTFKKRDRAEYNRWERDCEGFFIRAPLSFRREQQKVDFGVMYLSEPLKTLWQAHVNSALSTPGWIPTWTSLKGVMLNSLGTPEERAQIAFEQLAKAKQRPNQSPTELMDYLRPIWEELGNSYPPQLQVLSYLSSLQTEIRNDIERLPILMRSTLPQIEEQANIIYRRQGNKRQTRPHSPKIKDQKPKESSSGTSGATQAPRKQKKPKMAYTGAKRTEKTDYRSGFTNDVLQLRGSRPRCKRLHQSEEAGR
jgi:hypothetical protein